ncbi:MAG TPA: hypothetical protein DCO77_11945 [Nitrospiraceae bacterium]|nr:hypothetical protein [Nitrospiraceae bacterium]
MAKKEYPIAKITRPNVRGIFERERLFRVLDDGREQPITWITGPPGSGKTTLVASYLDARRLPCLWYQIDEGDGDLATFFYYTGLAAKKAAPRFRKPLPLFTPEYIHGINVFTRRYFESLFQRLKPPVILVLDNYQDVPMDSGFHEVIREGLSVIPEGVTVAILSRSDPPPALARLQARNMIHGIGWDDIRFDRGEADALITAKSQKKLPDEVLKQLHARLDGWAAGLVLSIQKIKKEKIDLQSLGSLRSGEIFNYFASEIFDKTDEERQAFLLKTAFLPKMTAPMTEKLTGMSDAEQVLSTLNRRHYFTGQHSSGEGVPVYQYHPLFREFLLSRAAKVYDASTMYAIQSEAAGLLEASGFIEDAVELYHQVQNLPRLVGLILEHAQAFLTQGRHQTLGAWITRLPEEALNENPSLLFWLSMCHLPFDPRKGGAIAERAYDLYQVRNDMAGMFMSCYPSVGAICYEQADFTSLDRWIAVLEKIFQTVTVFPSPDIEARSTNSLFIALVLRQPHHPDIQKYRDRFLTISRTMEDANLRIQLEADITLHYLWTGNFPKAFEVIDTLLHLMKRHKASLLPLPVVLLKTYEAMYYAFTGMHEACSDAVKTGLEGAQSNGVAIMNGQLMTHAVAGSLGAGDLEAAERLLKELEIHLQGSQRVIVAYYHYMKAWHALLSDDSQTAFHHITEALNLAEAIGFTFLEALVHHGMALVQIQRGAHKEAGIHIAKAQQIGRAMKSTILDFMCLAARAQLSFHEGNVGETEAHLRSALSLGKKQGYTFFLFWRPSAIAALCAVALEAGIEIVYVQDLIRRRSLVPDEPPISIENWPWQLKISTLGLFDIIREGKPIPFSRKAQQKPLAMLKAILASGGQSVAVDQLAYTLWPDADGDQAHRSLEITLLRLRRLLGTDNSVQLRDGKLSLDPRYCWVDAWAFERMIEDAEQELLRGADIGMRSEKQKTGRSGSAALKPESEGMTGLLERILAIYRGNFLPADTSQPWTISYRERLRSKFVRLILRYGNGLEQRRQWEAAAECYQKGLDVDSLAEEFYQRLMICCQQLGQQVEGVAVYRRCCSVLSSTLGLLSLHPGRRPSTRPSPEPTASSSNASIASTISPSFSLHPLPLPNFLSSLSFSLCSL